MGHADEKRKKKYQKLTRPDLVNIQCDIRTKLVRNVFHPATPTELIYQGESLSA